MNWDAVGFDWNQVRAFLATVDEGSLSAAARVLKSTQPTLGRQIAALERHLGVILFERIGRGLVLTPSGLELVDHVRDMAEAATRVSLAATGQSQIVEGRVRITASDVFAAYILPPVIARIQERAPKLYVDIVAANDIADLQHREADIAIRNVRPEGAELIAKRMQDANAYFYAAPDYLDRRGRPQNLADCSSHDFVCFGDVAQMIGYLAPLGINLTAENIRLGSENGIAAWNMVRHGLGIGVMSQDVAEMDETVEKVLPQMPAIRFPVWLTTHRELHTSRRIRLVFDILAEFFQNGLRPDHVPSVPPGSARPDDQ